MAQLEFKFPTQPKRLPPAIRALCSYGLAAIAVCLALALRLWLAPWVGDLGPYTIFFLAIVLLARFCPVGPASFATVLSACLADYFLIGDKGTFTFSDPGVWLTQFLFLLASAIVIASMEQNRRASAREGSALKALQERVAELDASEEFNRRIVASTADSLQVLDLAGNVLAVSESGRKLLQVENAEDLRGTSWAGFWPASCHSKIQKAIEQARSGTPGSFAGPFRTKDGSERWWDVVITPMCNRAGTPERLLAVARDMTDYRRTEENVRLSESEFRAMFENAIVGKVQADPHTLRFNRVNRALCQLTGYTEQELLEKCDRELTHPDDREYSERLVQNALKGGLVNWVCEKRYVRKNGEQVYVNVGGTVIRKDTGEPWRVFCLIQDVTQRRLAEEALILAKEDLARANHELEAKVKERTLSLQQTTDQLNSFCYSVAHDLRAPLRTQMGFARILLDDYGPQLDESGQRYLRLVLQAAERQGRLIEDLLTHVSISRADLPMQPLSLAQCLDQACADLSGDLELKRALIDRSGDEHCRVLADGSSLHLIILNLLSNALKFVRPGLSPHIRIHSQRVGPFIRLSVADNGIGIPAEHMDKLFGLFQRLPGSKDFEGTGMGLAIVKKAAERMGGRVGAESEPGKGSRFWVELQAADEPTRASKDNLLQPWQLSLHEATF